MTMKTFKNLFFVIASFLLLFIFAICSANPDAGTDDGTDTSTKLQISGYTETVKNVAPSVESNSKSKSVMSDGGVNTTLFSVFDANVTDTTKDAVLKRNWIGWYNEQPTSGSDLTVDYGLGAYKEILAPAAPDGWMPFKEDTNGNYLDDSNSIKCSSSHILIIKIIRSIKQSIFW